jgi:hypothetical protein
MLFNSLNRDILKTGFLKNKIGSRGHTFSRLKEVNKFSNIDILFIGSSHAYRGYDTRIFDNHGYTSFNLGTPAQTPIQTKYLLEKHIKKLAPKLIIIDVYQKLFTLRGNESTIDLVSNTSNIGLDELKLCIETNSFEAFKSLIVSFLTNKKKFIEPKQKTYDTYVSGGFVQSSKTIYDVSDPPPITSKKLLKSQFENIDSIIKIAKNNNSRIILIKSPITKHFYKKFKISSVFDSIMDKKGEYYNINKTDIIDSLFFYDKDHLTQKGVEVYNNFLIENIIRKKFTDD